MPVELRPETSEPASPDHAEDARNFTQLIFRRISLVKQNHIAKDMGLSEATVNRIVSGERGLMLEELYAFTAALGFAVIEREGEGVTLTEAEYEALRTLARKGLDDDRRNRRPK